MLEAGALKLGCAVIPAGTGNTEQQIEAIADLEPTAYVGTAAFLRILVEKFIELGKPFPVKRAITGGDALPPALRSWLKEKGLSSVLQFYGTADLGNIAYEEERRAFLAGVPAAPGPREFSEETAREIDIAVREIVKAAYDKALAILARERATLERGAARLLEKETLTEADLADLRDAIRPA